MIVTDSRAVPPPALSYEQAKRFGPYRFASLARGLREHYATPQVVGRLFEDKTNDVTDPRVMAHAASFWKAMANDEARETDAGVFEALDKLAEYEPRQSVDEQRRPWLKAFVRALLDRYDDPGKALQAMDVLHAVLGYPNELTPLTTYRSDPGIPVDSEVNPHPTNVSERAVAEARKKAMRRFLLE
jgi:hypothetical protein